MWAPFVGRERELEHLAAIYARTRIFTLVGPGGMGKSRLALRLVDRIRPHYPDGVVVLDMGLGLGAFWPRVRNAIEQSGPHQLLVLDNCEAAAPMCADIASSWAGSHVLATSREPLHIEEELVWRVGALQLPPLDTCDPSALRKSDAVKLFAIRLRSVLPDFAVTAQTAAAVARICRWTYGLPLALEIAAMHSSRTGLSTTANRMDAAYMLRVEGSRSAPGRHRSLAATIGWSYNLLTELERLLFRRLAVFVGGWSLEAAESVCSDERISRALVAPLLDAMVSRSVILLDDRALETRFRFAPFVRTYASDRLRASGEADVLQQRHASYMVTRTTRVHPAIIDAEDVALPAADWGNLRGAMHWAVRSKNVNIAFQLGIASYPTWYLGGRFDEGAMWLFQAQVLLANHERRATHAPLAALAAHLALLSGHPSRARLLLQSAVTTGSPENVTLATHFLSLVELWSGDLEAALHFSQQADVAMQQVELDSYLRRLLESALLTISAQINIERGDNEPAADLVRHAASVAQAHASRFWHARALHIQALLAARRHQYPLALQLLLNAIASQTSITDQDGLVQSLCALGDVRLDAGLRDSSLDMYAQAAGHARAIGHRFGLLWALEGVARSLPASEIQSALQVARVCEGLRSELGCVPRPDQKRRTNVWQKRVRGEVRPKRFQAATASAAADPWTIGDAMRLASSVSAPRATPGTAHLTRLSRREQEVIGWLARDLTHQQIAKAMGISAGTVRSHVDHMLTKLGLHSRAQLVALALQTRDPV